MDYDYYPASIWQTEYQETFPVQDGRVMVEMGASRSPHDILALIRQHKPVTLDFLAGAETCRSFTTGKLLGEGKSGSVFELKDEEDRGTPVVIKQFEAKSAPVIKNLEHGKDLYVLSSSLNDIVMSSIFNSFYDGGLDYCLSFPYFKGFFVCGRDGYAVIEKLDTTMARYIGSSEFDPEVFRSLVFQVFFAVRFMNLKQVVHNDLHAKNVMTRNTDGISYRGVALKTVKNFAYSDGGKTYYHPNYGVVAKIMDFDFSVKYSHPAVTPQKVYTKKSDDWNLQFRFSKTYDLLTFVGYMAYYVVLRTPGDHKTRSADVQKARDFVTGLAEYIVTQAEHQVGPIPKRKHYEKEANGKRRSRDAISKLLDMVSVPQYRPYEEYCHLDLDEILNVPGFSDYQKRRESAFVVGSM